MYSIIEEDKYFSLNKIAPVGNITVIATITKSKKQMQTEIYNLFKNKLRSIMINSVIF